MAEGSTPQGSPEPAPVPSDRRWLSGRRWPTARQLTACHLTVRQLTGRQLTVRQPVGADSRWGPVAFPLRWNRAGLTADR
jgi:hypothetical protein